MKKSLDGMYGIKTKELEQEHLLELLRGYQRLGPFRGLY